jgi:hypothetical protein
MGAKFDIGRPAAVLGVATAMLLVADSACAQQASSSAQSPYARYGAEAGGGDPVTAIDSMTTVGDEPSSLPNPTVDGSTLSGEATDWSASPAGDDRALAVVTAPSKAHSAQNQPSNVSAGSGPIGDESDAH